jgi:hypothetical protein
VTNQNASKPVADAAVVTLADAATFSTPHTAQVQPASAANGAVLAALLASGRRAPDRPAVMPALIAYWRYLAVSSVADRRETLEQLRVRVRAGHASPRAWVGMALGETDFAIAQEAVLGYVAAVPVSIETRDQHRADALDWIRRGLALNRAAVFAALLSLEDAALLESLSCLRSQLTDAEATSVLAASEQVTDPATREFVADWLQLLG